MNLSELQKLYSKVLKTNDTTLELDFLEELTSNNDHEIIEFHYSLLKEKSNNEMFYYIRGCFKNRGKEGEAFLLKKLEEETDTSLRSEALFILGTMRCKEAKPYAIAAMQEDDYDLQYKGVIVLGWLGKNKADVELLEAYLKDTSHDEQLRAFSASAMRQIWWDNKRQSKAILKAYNDVLPNETSEEINLTILSCTQDILRKKFGIKETQYGDISGDVNVAKPKALKAIKKELAS